MTHTHTAPDHPAFLAGPPKRLLIDGGWHDALSGATFATVDPATGIPLTEVAAGDASDIDVAVGAARRAFEGPWRRAKPVERQRLLRRLADLVEEHADELARLDTLDMGAPLRRTRVVALRSAERLHWYAAHALTLHGRTIENSVPGEFLSYTVREPVGVVGGITPWNAPLGAAVYKVGPALATGCTVVLKPAEESPLSALRFAELCLEAGVPNGVVNVVTGLGETAGAALAAHAGVDKVAFTGAHVTGQRIVAASAGNLKRLSLELGGKSPDVVFADADLDAAAEGAAMAAFNNSGQICSAGTRLLVEHSIHDEFVDRVAAVGRGLRVGNGLDPDTVIGPLVSEQQLTRVLDYLQDGTTVGATAVTGGTRLTDGELKDGYFVAPTVFTQVRPDMRIAREEIFGPVLCVQPFSDLEEAGRMANDTPFGLGSGVWTRDVGKAHRLARLIRAGSVWVNCYQVLDPGVPFGGFKLSGYGRENGTEQLDEYLSTKSVWVRVD